MTVGSLFSGIGGLELGLEWAGMETIWQVEKEPYCRKILNKHWPDVPVYHDVTEVDFSEVRSPDVVAGGFPCQDISLAGKGAGIEGERSGLWWEMHRAIRVLRPRYAIIENVPALTHRGLGAVLGSLAEIRYDAEWQIISAAAMGAPHIRERIFIVAYPEGERSREERRLRRDESEERVAGSGEAEGETKVADAYKQGLEGYRQNGQAGEVCRQETADAGSGKAGQERPNQWRTEPAVGRVADGIPNRVDRLRGLGNAVVPHVAEFVGRHVMRHAQEHTDYSGCVGGRGRVCWR